MEIDIDNLLTIKNYAKEHDVTPAYIYKLIKEEKMNAVVIDGVKFIDKSRFKEIQNKAWWNRNFNTQKSN